MLDCLILGDSIAVGTHSARPECLIYAKSGVNSRQFNIMYAGKNFTAKTVVISLGSNDHQGVRTKSELLKVRQRIEADRVYWIMPAVKPDIQEIVEDVANQYHDWIIKIPSLSKDGIHPTAKGYSKISGMTK